MNREQSTQRNDRSYPLLELLPIAGLVGIAATALLTIGGVPFEEALVFAPVMILMWASLSMVIIASEYIHER